MKPPPMTKENQLHFAVMVALEPGTLDVIRQSALTKSEQDQLIAICYNEQSGSGAYEKLLAKDWKRLGPAVEACFYQHQTAEIFEQALKGLVTARGRRFVQRWSAKVADALENDNQLEELISERFPEMAEPIRRYRQSANTQYRRRVVAMLAIRRPIIDQIIDQADIEDPRKKMADERPEKISLDGVIIDIPATSRALKEALDARRERYSWDGIATEFYVNDEGEERRRVIFYVGSR